MLLENYRRSFLLRLVPDPFPPCRPAPSGRSSKLARFIPSAAPVAQLPPREMSRWSERSGVYSRFTQSIHLHTHNFLPSSFASHCSLSSQCISECVHLCVCVFVYVCDALGYPAPPRSHLSEHYTRYTCWHQPHAHLSEYTLSTALQSLFLQAPNLRFCYRK